MSQSETTSKIYFRTIWFLLLNIFFSNPCFSQDYHAVTISLPEGLSQSSVYTISQDNSGFLWAGTQDGLNKYDGLNFTTFYNQPFDTTSISSGYITTILHDSKGKTWIGTANNGLNLKLKSEEKYFRFDSENGKGLRDNAVKFLMEDSRGNIFVATMNDVSVIRISGKEKKQADFVIENLKNENNKQAFESVTSICEKDSSHYWVASKNGLFLVDYSKSVSKIISCYGSENGFGKSEIISLKKDQLGNLWVATSAGITVLNKENKIVRTIRFSIKSFLPDYVNALCFTSDGSLWAATAEGLFHIPKEGVANILTSVPKTEKILPDNRSLSGTLLSITEDKINRGLIWIGSESNGLIKLVPVSKKFHTNNLESVLKTAFVFSLLKDHKNILWLGTTSGLLRYDRQKNKYAHFTREAKNSNPLPYNFISALFETENENIYLGSPLGLIKVQNPWSDKPSFKHLVINPVSPEAPVRHSYTHNSKIYIVFPYRVFSYDETRNLSTKILAINNSVTDSKWPMAFSSMAIDHAGNWWMGTTNGLLLYRNQGTGIDTAKHETFYHQLNDTNSLRCQNINDITISEDGVIWICTSNGFSKVINRSGKISFQNYSTQNGLKNNAVYGALENKEDHSLWLSTNGGLTRFDPKNSVFTNYDLHDGLQSNEFNGGSYFKSADNEFFFGGVNGYTSFYPKEIVPDTQAPRTYITAFNLPGVETNPDLLLGKKIELEYYQNSFSIDFIALHSVNPSKNSYEYMLEGYQKNWIKSGNTHRVNFSHLPAGDYVFKVRGWNNDRTASAESLPIKITILAPFWQTIWFYAIVAATLLIFFWMMHLYRLRLKMGQLKEIEKIRKEIASDFHDELGHRLTTISWFSEILKNKLKPEEKDLRIYLSKIMDTSGTLYHTMKDMLWAMDPAKDSVTDLYYQIRDFGESLFDQTGFEFTAGEAPQGLQDKNIPLAYKRHVLLIFKEAMHNCFKHSKGSKVELNILRENNHVVISLNDNGKGFNTSPASMGYGLKNVEKRTELIHGKVFITSCTEGTKIKLEVPLQN